MYKSPISTYAEELAREMIKEQDEYVLAQVRYRLKVDIDEEELIKALKYDREQYKKGYEEGKKGAIPIGYIENWLNTYCFGFNKNLEYLPQANRLFVRDAIRSMISEWGGEQINMDKEGIHLRAYEDK